MAIFSLQAFSAANLEGFHKRFNVVRNDDGTLRGIKMKLFASKFDLKPFVEKVKNDVLDEVKRLKKEDFTSESEIEEFLQDLQEGTTLPYSLTSEEDENIKHTRIALQNLKNVNVKDLFNKIYSGDVLKKFELDLKEALFKFDLAVIANPNDSKYFYRRNVTYEVVTRALEFAKKRFSEVPVLNLASYVIVKVHDLILEQRLYHQNMLLNYLENVSAEELGISEHEINGLFSSLYEAQIAPINFMESKKAQENWERYGIDKFFAVVRTANNKLRRDTTAMTVNARYNFAFFEAVENGERVVKNLLYNQHAFSRNMSVAYNFDKPNKVKRMRSLIQLSQIALGFISIPEMIKTQADSFLSSFYKEQSRVEGALLGYFEMTKNEEMAKTIFNQSNNPYLIY